MPRTSSGRNGDEQSGIVANGAVSGLAGTTQSGTGAYGTVPTVPNPFETQQQAIAGNVNNLAALYGLASNVNTFGANQAALPYQINLPGYGAMTQQSSANILNNLQGKVGDDVISQMWQTAAEKGIASGLPGSGQNNAALLRALGLTSYGMQQAGDTALTNAIARTPTGQQLNPSAFLVTPAQQQEAQSYANYYAAMPNPSSAAAAGLGAARSGVGAGLGGVGAMPMPSYGGTAGYGTAPVMGYGAPSYSSAGNSYASSDPYASWSNWWAGIPKTSSGPGYSYISESPMGGNLATDQWWEDAYWGNTSPSSGYVYMGANPGTGSLATDQWWDPGFYE